jgi:hypothetical protein
MSIARVRRRAHVVAPLSSQVKPGPLLRRSSLPPSSSQPRFLVSVSSPEELLFLEAFAPADDGGRQTLIFLVAPEADPYVRLFRETQPSEKTTPNHSRRHHTCKGDRSRSRAVMKESFESFCRGLIVCLVSAIFSDQTISPFFPWRCRRRSAFCCPSGRAAVVTD